MSYTPDYDPLSQSQKKEVCAWMDRHAFEYPTSTQAAEACGDDLDLAGSDRDATIPEDVYDIASEFFKEE